MLTRTNKTYIGRLACTLLLQTLWRCHLGAETCSCL